MNIPLTFVSLLSIAVCAVQAKTEPLEYIELISQPLEHEKELKWIVEEVEKGEDSIEGTTRALDEAKKLSIDKGDYTTKIILDVFDLVPVDPISETEQFSFEVKCLIDITSLSFGSYKSFLSLLNSNQLPENNKKLFNYLKVYVYKKWPKCLLANNLKLAFFNTLDKLNKEAEKAFDMLMKTNEEFPSDAKLASVAEKTDFVKGKNLNGKHMMSAMKKYLKEFAPEVKTNRHMLARYVLESCSRMYSTLVEFFDGYNLARSLSPELPITVEEESATFIKLNEYSRLCVQALDVATSKVALENIVNSANRFSFF